MHSTQITVLQNVVHSLIYVYDIGDNEFKSHGNPNGHAHFIY
jgi:hypothetical protein